MGQKYFYVQEERGTFGLPENPSLISLYDEVYQLQLVVFGRFDMIWSRFVINPSRSFLYVKDLVISWFTLDIRNKT